MYDGDNLAWTAAVTIIVCSIACGVTMYNLKDKEYDMVCAKQGMEQVVELAGKPRGNRVGL